VLRLLFGLASLLVLLAVLAAVPVVNFLSLGYLLQVEGSVARTGRFREAFPLFTLAPRLGSIVLGVWLWLVPLRLMAGAAADARLIDPGSAADRMLHLGTQIAWLAVSVHLCLALARGGALTAFFRPWRNIRWLRQRLKSGQYLDTASAHIRSFVRDLRLREHFWLGLRGYVGAMVWLAGPTALFAAGGDASGPRVGLTLVGGVLLAWTLAWMPFLQTRFAAEGRLRAMFELRAIRTLFGYAPLTWWLAILVVYVLALPLYLLKAVLLPRDAAWLITLIFVASIYPAKVVTGWAYRQAVVRKQADRPAHAAWRWLARLGMVPLLGVFVFLLYLSQFIGAHGTAGLFEHHSFLLPWPGEAAF
jgi:hypothetical protein